MVIWVLQAEGSLSFNIACKCTDGARGEKRLRESDAVGLAGHSATQWYCGILGAPSRLRRTDLGCGHMFRGQPVSYFRRCSFQGQRRSGHTNHHNICRHRCDADDDRHCFETRGRGQGPQSWSPSTLAYPLVAKPCDGPPPDGEGESVGAARPGKQPRRDETTHHH